MVTDIGVEPIVSGLWAQRGTVSLICNMVGINGFITVTDASANASGL